MNPPSSLGSSTIFNFTVRSYLGDFASAQRSGHSAARPSWAAEVPRRVKLILMAEDERITRRAGRYAVGVIIAFGVILVAREIFFHPLPPRARTFSNIRQTKIDLITFARIHGRLPNRLSEAPETNGTWPAQINSRIDAWGTPLFYRANADGSVILGSYGADRRPGGKGEDADLTYSFIAREGSGEWAKTNTPFTSGSE